MAIPTTSRATLVKGPATITHKGVTVITTDDFEVKPVIGLDDTNSSFYGRIDSFLSTIIWEMSFTPLGIVTDALFAMLWDPVLNYVRGRSIFGATDSDIVIHSIDGMHLTLAAGGISAVPEITFAAVGSLFGSCSMQAIGKVSTAWSDNAKRYVLATLAHPGFALDRTQIVKAPYTCGWGAAPFDSFNTKAGMKVSANLSFLSDDITNNDGIVDRCQDSVIVQAKGEPVGITAAQLLARVPLQGAGFQRGMTLSALSEAASLVIDGEKVGTPKFTLYNAAIEASSLRFGAANRVGEITWRGAPNFAESAFGAPCAIAVNAEPEE